MIQIEAKIANIINSSRVAINAGSARGVVKGDYADVWEDIDVEDPDTAEPLGTVRVSKLKLVVVQVEPGFSIANVRVDPDSGIAGGVLRNFSGVSKKIRTSRPNDDSVIIYIGDPVTVQTTEDELPEPLADPE